MSTSAILVYRPSDSKINGYFYTKCHYFYDPFTDEMACDILLKITESEFSEFTLFGELDKFEIGHNNSYYSTHYTPFTGVIVENYKFEDYILFYTDNQLYMARGKSKESLINSDNLIEVFNMLPITEFINKYSV